MSDEVTVLRGPADSRSTNSPSGCANPSSWRAPLIDSARELDLFYVPTRYPNGLDAGTPAEAFSAAQSARALDLAAQFVDAAGSWLGG
jgi:hypothetical protein